MLWYLHLCADAGVVVTAYRDPAVGTLLEAADGSAAFSQVVLRPQVTIADPSKVELARGLHHMAHERCFIARSVRCEVTTQPEIGVAG